MQCRKLTGLFINFHDSFSENIIDEFNNQLINLTTIDWDDQNLYSQIRNIKYSFIILGPGPGHVDDYKNITLLVNETLSINKKVVGFCLGHQIIAKALGYELTQLEEPLHGKSFLIQLTDKFFKEKSLQKVQFYNSWYVKYIKLKNVDSLITVINENSMVSGIRSYGILSYQFHPESVGTTCPSEFFSFIKEFLYNKDDGNEETKI